MSRLILTYHSIDPTGSVISVDPMSFRAQMAFLAETGIPVVPLASLKAVPSGVAITFDDGLRNFYEYAFPVLLEYRIPATVFVVSDYCGRKNNWPSQPSTGIPLLELMDWDQLREVQRHGIHLGAHTATHPRLTQVPPQQIDEEFSRCCKRIEQETGTAVRTMSYPYGDSDARVRTCAARHFDIACGTVLSPVADSSDPMNLPRIDAYYVRSRYWFESLPDAHALAYLFLRRVLRAVRQRSRG